ESALLWANIADQVSSGIGVAVRVTVETGHALAGLIGAAVIGRIELLLRELTDQQTKTFQLFRVENAVEGFEVVVDGDQLSFGHIAQIWPGCQEDGGREFRQKMLR